MSAQKTHYHRPRREFPLFPRALSYINRLRRPLPRACAPPSPNGANPLTIARRVFPVSLRPAGPAGTTSVPLRTSEGRARHVRIFGGTCLSGPPFNVGSSVPFRRGLKSRAESGAKAPHSMECGDSSPLFGEGFSLHHLAVGPDRTTITGRRGTRPSNPRNGGPHNWRDLLVRSVVVYPGFCGHDKRAPPYFGGTCSSRPHIRRDLLVRSIAGCMAWAGSNRGR